MGDYFLISLSDVSCPVVVHPEWNFREQETLIRVEHRTQQGKAFVYRWGSFSRFDLPLRFVNSSDQSRMNAWWDGQEEVSFTLDSSASLSTVLCRIVNRSQPLERFVRPYDDLFEGTLKLESLDDSGRIRQPFVLDDEILGLLNKNYNALIK